MKGKSAALVIGIGLLLVLLAFFAFTPTVIEKPVYINRYVEDPVPIYVEPAWWSYYGPPWGGYGKPWKMGSGLPGMKGPHGGPHGGPSHPPMQPPNPPPAPAPQGGPSQPPNPAPAPAPAP